LKMEASASERYIQSSLLIYSTIILTIKNRSYHATPTNLTMGED
jgi:hypothetical protein